MSTSISLKLSHEEKACLKEVTLEVSSIYISVKLVQLENVFVKSIKLSV